MPRGYDDADNIVRVRTAMSDRELSRRQAIIGVVGERNLRRIEMKMKRLDEVRAGFEADTDEASRMRKVEEDHVASYPCGLRRTGNSTVFEAYAPAGGGPDGLPDFMEEKDATCHAVVGFHGDTLVGHVSEGTFPGPRRSLSEATTDVRGAFDGLRAFGLTYGEHLGTMVPSTGPCEIQRMLALRLARDWATPLGGRHPGSEELYVLALTREGERLARCGLREVVARVSPGTGILAGTVDNPWRQGWRDRVGTVLEDGRYLSLLLPLTAFMHGHLYDLSPDTVARYAGRPRDLLRFHLREAVKPPVPSAVGPGDVMDHEVDWLFDLLGGKEVAPVHPHAVTALVATRHLVDVDRAREREDAAGLASLVAAVVQVSCPPGSSRVGNDAVSDVAFVLGRLVDGPDSDVGYGEVARRLADMDVPATGHAHDGEGMPEVATVYPLHAVVRRVLATRDLPRRLREHLVLPTLARAIMDRTGRGADEARKDVGLLATQAGPGFATDVDALCRDMAWSGLSLTGMAEAGAELARGRTDKDPFETGWSERGVHQGRWNAMTPLLVPRWRRDGPDMVATALSRWVAHVADGKRHGKLTRAVARVLGTAA